MPEHTGKRDLSFSLAHRNLPSSYAYTDLDGLGYCGTCAESLFLVETFRVEGTATAPPAKEHRALLGLAQLASRPLFLVAYRTKHQAGCLCMKFACQLASVCIRPRFPLDEGWGDWSSESLPLAEWERIEGILRANHHELRHSETRHD